MVQTSDPDNAWGYIGAVGAEWEETDTKKSIMRWPLADKIDGLGPSLVNLSRKVRFALRQVSCTCLALPLSFCPSPFPSSSPSSLFQSSRREGSLIPSPPRHAPFPLGSLPRRPLTCPLQIDRVLDLFEPGQLALAFNGGKDSTAVMHLVREACARHPTHKFTHVQVASPPCSVLCPL